MSVWTFCKSFNIYQLYRPWFPLLIGGLATFGLLIFYHQTKLHINTLFKDDVNSELHVKWKSTNKSVSNSYHCLSRGDLPLSFQWDEIGPYHSLLGQGHPIYQKNMRNPCWKEQLTTSGTYTGQKLYSHIIPKAYPKEVLRDLQTMWEDKLKSGSACRNRCLPYFYILGFTKCGTTDLFDMLQKHPLVAANVVKEIHWWNRARVFQRSASPIRYYADLFDKPAFEVEQYTEGDFHPKVIGEATPSTIWWTDNWEFLPENAGHSLSEGPKYHVGHYIQEVTPESRFIITMRNPTSRVYSWYLYTGGRSPEEFHKLAVEGMAVMRSCLRSASLWACVNDPRQRIHYNFRIRVSMYYPYIREWLKLFPRQHFFFTTLEEYGADRMDVLNAIGNFLGLGPYPDSIMADIQEAAVINSQQKRVDDIGPMLNETKALLDDFFLPYNHMLANLLDDNRFLFR